MAYDRDSFLSGLAVGRVLWRPYEVIDKEFSILIDTRYSPSGHTFCFALAAPPSAATVYWGDGTSELVTGPTHTLGWYRLYHEYSVGGIYLLSISGGIWQLAFGGIVSDRTPECLISVNSPLRIHESLGNGEVWTIQMDFATMFRDCNHLIHLPKDMLSGYLPTGAFLWDVTGMFSGCSSLPTLPERLFYGMTDRYARFSALQMFQNCVSLTALPPDLFSYGFVGCNNFRNCFYCYDSEFWPVQTAITSEVPDLWNTHPSADGSGCYYCCQNAANYADIPTTWGGPS